MSRLHWRFHVRRWHRRLGIVSALFVLVLSVTGFLLNRSHELGFDRAPLENSLLRRLYGLAPGSAQAGVVHALPSGDLRAEGGQLRLAGHAIGACPHLVGVVEQSSQVLAVCSNRLWLLTPTGEVIDQADSVRGIPEGLSAVGQGQGQVLLRHGEESLAVDLGDLSIKPAIAPPSVAWSGVPAADDRHDDINWERVLLDLHSGRLFGPWGVRLVDTMAILFAILAISGLIISWRRRHHA
ncbi:MAG TPA: PepSY-associated TM helix domain-containing protein [Moraxellaceae bacterium]|nr:PepSY-associated TM helix domain-containing protein [Moraxellaceae bacterium]